MMGHEGGDTLLAGAACGRLLGHCAGLCLQDMGGDLKTAWRLSFSDEKRVRGVYTRDVLPFTLPYIVLRPTQPSTPRGTENE